MLSIGQVYNKDGMVLCVLDILDYNLKKYALMSVESSKLLFIFFEIIKKDNGFELKQVFDKDIEYALFEIFEAKDGMYGKN